MTTTVLFVHGTGVRRDDYHKTLVRVTAGLAHALPTAVVEPCLWGDDEGAKLARAGISIPDFSGQPPSADDASGHTALWQLLSADPSFELRELTGVAQPPGLRNSAALDALPAQVRGLGKHAPALAQLPDSGDAAARAATWAVACAAVAASD